MEYKFSTSTNQEIIDLLSTFNIEWDGSSTPISSNNLTFVYIGQIIQSFELDEIGNIINQVYSDGLHFDILTDVVFNIPSNIIQHYPINPKHRFFI